MTFGEVRDIRGATELLDRAVLRQSIVIEASIIFPLTIEFQNLIAIIIVSNSGFHQLTKSIANRLSALMIEPPLVATYCDMATCDHIEFPNGTSEKCQYKRQAPPHQCHCKHAGLYTGLVSYSDKLLTETL